MDASFFLKMGTGSNIRSLRVSLLPVMAAPDASRTGWTRGRARLIGVDASRHPSLPSGRGRRRHGQRRGEAARPASQATARARARGLVRAGSSVRQAP